MLQTQTVEHTDINSYLDSTTIPNLDLIVSMFGVMFTPQPEVAAAQLRRVTKAGGQIALANLTPEGFMGILWHVLGVME